MFIRVMQSRTGGFGYGRARLSSTQACALVVGEYQIWLQLLTGELTQRGAAEKWGVDPTTIMRIRKVAREGALAHLASSRPGQRHGGEDPELFAARAEISRLEETVKEQAIELVMLRGNLRSGF